MWFFLAILGYILIAGVFILDKYILSTAKEKPEVYAMYSTLPFFLAFLLLPFGAGGLIGIDWVWAIVSGLTFGLAFLAMFLAFEKGEVSHMSPFIGAVVILVVACSSALLFRERLTTTQLIGVAFLMAASFLLSLEQTEKNKGFHSGFFWAILSGILFALSYVSAKYLYLQYSFLTVLMWTKGLGGFIGLGLLLSPRVRKIWKQRKATFASHHGLALVATDKGAAVVGLVLTQYAMARESVTVVNALGGVQYIVMFLGVLALTKWRPKIFQEYFTRRELQMQIAAIFLVAIGAWLCIP